MMLKLKLIVVLLGLSLIAKAQVYKSGTVFSYYYDINPDTSFYLTLGSHGPSATYIIDFNADFQDDFKIELNNESGMANGSKYVNIIPLNTKCFVMFGRVDSLYSNALQQWLTTPMAKPLSLGDSINGLTSQWVNTSLSIINHSLYMGTSVHPMDFEGGNDLYIGIKRQTFTDTIYGWIRVNCPTSSGCSFKDYSSTAVVAGIKENQASIVKVFPVPVTDILRIQGKQHQFENASIEIRNYSGQLILAEKYSNSVDISQFCNGLYLLQIVTESNKSYYSKFIKE